MTRWLLEVKIAGVKQPVQVTGNEWSPRPTYETLLKTGVEDVHKGMWYPPSRILEAKVTPVGGEVK